MSDQAKLDAKLIARWQSVSQELGISVVAPAEITVGDLSCVCEVYLPDFGSNEGMVIVSERTERRERDQLRRSGKHLVIAQARTDNRYGRSTAIDELSDFGWYGPANDVPDWYAVAYKVARQSP